MISRRIFIGSGAAALAAAQKSGIRVGCQANGFPLKANDFDGLIAALAAMRKLAYTGFECNIRYVEPEFGRAAEARKRIEATGVRFIGAHVNMNMAPDKAAGIAAGIAALGGESAVMSGSGLSPEGKFENAALAAKAKKLNDFGKAFQAQRVKLTYHNHNPEFANANAEMDGLARETDPALVSFLMDAGHGYLGGGNPAEFMARHPKRIYGIHLKTFKGKEVAGQVPLGEGDFGFEALAASIKKTGWTGWLITEEGGGPRAGNTAALGPDREYIRKIFGV